MNKIRYKEFKKFPPAAVTLFFKDSVFSIQSEWFFNSTNGVDFAGWVDPLVDTKREGGIKETCCFGANEPGKL